MNNLLGFGHYAGVKGWVLKYCSGPQLLMDPNEHNPFGHSNVLGRVPSLTGNDAWEHAFIARGAEGGVAYGQYCQAHWDKASWIKRWVGPCEPPATTLQDAVNLVAFYQGFAGYAHDHGRLVLYGSFSTTRPDEHTFAAHAPGVAACDGLAVHEYARTCLDDPGQKPWFVFKYRWFVEELAKAGLHPDVHVTELGLDDGTGWTTKTNSAGIAAQFRWYAFEAVKDPYVKGLYVFAASSYSFPTFLINEQIASAVESTNRALPAPVSGPIPVVPPPGPKETTVNEFCMPVLGWPVEGGAGSVTQEFGLRPEYYRQYKQANGQPFAGHDGRDIAVKGYTIVDAPDLIALAAGEAWPYLDPGFGNACEIWCPDRKHPVFKLIYAHMLKPSPLQLGQLVLPGMIVGQMGYSGNCDPKGIAGAHLHFGIKGLKLGFVNPGFNGWIDPRLFMER